jgi:hypothetical protein
MADPHTQSLLEKAASEKPYTVIVDGHFRGSRRIWEKNNYIPETFNFKPERTDVAWHKKNTLPDAKQKIKFVCGSVFEDLEKDPTREYIVVLHDDNFAQVKKQLPQLCVVTYDQFQNMVEILNGRPIDKKLPIDKKQKHEESVAHRPAADGEGPQEPSSSGKRSSRYGCKEHPVRIDLCWMMEKIKKNFQQQCRRNKTSEDVSALRAYSLAVTHYTVWKADHNEYIGLQADEIVKDEMEEVRRYVIERCNDPDLKNRWD